MGDITSCLYYFSKSSILTFPFTKQFTLVLPNFVDASCDAESRTYLCVYHSKHACAESVAKSMSFSTRSRPRIALGMFIPSPQMEPFCVRNRSFLCFSRAVGRCRLKKNKMKMMTKSHMQKIVALA